MLGCDSTGIEDPRPYVRNGTGAENHGCDTLPPPTLSMLIADAPSGSSEDTGHIWFARY